MRTAASKTPPGGRELLARVLRHHVVAGRLGPDDFADGATPTAVDGTTLRVRRTGAVVTVNGVTLDVTDATEGADVNRDPAARVALDDRTTPRTLFAPDNNAYAARSAVLAEPAQAGLARRVTAVHIVQGRYGRVDLLDGITLPALDGTRVRVSLSGEFTTVGDFVLTAAPVRSANGLLYATAFFLLPDVDLLDTILLREYVGFFRAVRAARHDGAPAAEARQSPRRAKPTASTPASHSA